MYGVVRTKRFERSFRKLKKSGLLTSKLSEEIEEVVATLANDKALPTKYRDHKLDGEFVEYRECHIRGDLLLIYQKREQTPVMVLLDIGSHSALFG